MQEISNSQRPGRISRGRFLRLTGLLGVSVLAGGVLAGCERGGASGGANAGRIGVLAAENTYGDVARRIGGSRVKVTSVISDPGADPHNFEVTPSDAKTISEAGIVIENGLGYDDWMDKMLQSNDSPARTVLNMQKIMRLPDDTKNPHLWYDPAAMPQLGRALVAELRKRDADHADEYRKNLETFIKSVDRYRAACGRLQADHPAATAAATEPVANYLLSNAGLTMKTPWTLQAAIMNDQDPSAQDIAAQTTLLENGRVDVFVYNEQVTSSLTKKFLDAAEKGGVPVVAVYETMPEGLDYAAWMLAEVKALEVALSRHESTTSLS